MLSIVTTRKKGERVKMSIMSIFPALLILFYVFVVEGFSGMDFNNLENWPGSGLSSGRIWDIGVSWNAIHLGPGIFDFSALDVVIAQYESFGASITYVVGGTPLWLAKNPDNPYYAPWLGPGSNSMPYDTDEFNNFITELAKRYSERISAYEIWNEPQLNEFLYPYTESELNCLATMTQLAYSTIKSLSGAKVLSASVLPRASSGGMSKASKYLTAIQSKGWNVDAFNTHIYPEDGQGAETWGGMLQSCRDTLSSMGAPTGEVWVTETNFNYPSGPRISEEDAPGLVNGAFDQAAAQGVSIIYWYAWNREDLGGLLFTQTSSAWATVAAHA